MSLLETVDTADKLKKVLAEVNAEIEQTVEVLLEIAEVPAAPIPENERASELESRARLIEELWPVQAAFQEVQSLREFGDTGAALSGLELVHKKVANAAQSYPAALLVADIERQAQKLEDELLELVEKRWRENVSVQFGKIEDKVKIAVDDALVAQIRQRRRHMEEDLLQDIGRLIDAIVDLQISQILDSGDELTLEKGPVTSIEQLIDVVQSFVLGLTTLEENAPTLASDIARRWGHYMVDKLTRKTLPSLFPSDPKKLDEFAKDVDGVKGLHEFLQSVEWIKGHELLDFASNFKNNWTASRQTVYLGRLRKALTGRYKKDDWDWDGEWDENAEDQDGPAGEDNDKDSEKVSDIFSDYSAELALPADPLLALFRALAPAYYGKNKMVLYVDTLYLLAQLETIKVGDTSLLQTQAFANLRLSSVMGELSSSMDRLLSSIKVTGSQNSRVSKEIMQLIQTAAEETTPAGPQVREHVLSSLVEQLASYLINTVETFEDISEQESVNIGTTIQSFRGCAAFFSDISTSVPSWIKLQRLDSIITGNLQSIEDLYNDNLLSDFTTQELENLVAALFADSDRRQRLIDVMHG